jgi:hypothetical protein
LITWELGLPGANTPAYFILPSVTKSKSFTTLNSTGRLLEGGSKGPGKYFLFQLKKLFKSDAENFIP